MKKKIITLSKFSVFFSLILLCECLRLRFACCEHQPIWIFVSILSLLYLRLPQFTVYLARTASTTPLEDFPRDKSAMKRKEKEQKTEIRTNRFETSHTIFMNILKMFLNCQVGRSGASAGFWYKGPNRINKYQFSEIVWHRYTQICINLSLGRRVMELSSWWKTVLNSNWIALNWD